MIRVLAVGLGLFIGLTALTQYQLSEVRTELAETKTKHAQVMQQAAEEVAKSNEQIRKVQEDIHEAHAMVEQAALDLQHRNRVDADAARAAGGRLRDRAAAVAAGGCPTAEGAEPAASGPPAETPARVLADVLGQLEPVCRQLAAIADERGAAGAACEQAYDAVFEVTNQEPTP